MLNINIIRQINTAFREHNLSRKFHLLRIILTFNEKVKQMTTLNGCTKYEVQMLIQRIIKA